MEVTNQENMMYGILSCISNEDAPIVFNSERTTSPVSVHHFQNRRTLSYRRKTLNFSNARTFC